MSDPLTIIHGDALSSLRELEDESVQTCVTSPPYFGLRSYGSKPLVWDGDPNCEHQWMDAPPRRNRWVDDCPNSPKQLSNAGTLYNASGGAFCECGAWRGELGLEPTPELYAEHVVQVFGQVKRVLRGDGTCWINLGDSYASGKGSCNNPGGGASSLEGHAKLKGEGAYKLHRGNKSDLEKSGLKPKDLVGIPWMVAFALRADGWYLRSDIIWSKPNPMPESVTDRPTKSHEYIFLMSKSQKYYYDAKSIAEPCIYATRNKRSVWSVSTKSFPDAHFATFPPDLIKPCVLAGAPIGGVVLDPFAGSGTTGKVAIELGRKAVLIEPKAEYVEMIKKRCQTTIGLPLE